MNDPARNDNAGNDGLQAGISRLLTPRSVAIVGASATPGALGASVLANLERNGFSGEIHLINPKRSGIGGRSCLPRVEDLPEGVDVAVLAIPQPAVLDAVRSLAARRVGAAIIFSAGFAEAGETGMAEQREIARIAAETGMLIEGPNCLGMINYRDRVPLTFVEVGMRPEAASGTVAANDRAIGLVSQSGAMMAVLCTTLAGRQLPLSFAVSSGNEAASHAEDFVAFMLDDPATRVIAMIVEQFRHPARMQALARRAQALGKRIVLLHPGRSQAASESAATHTGAIAGDHALMRLKLGRAGVIMAESLEELADISEIALRCEVLPAPGVAVLGESGAFKALSLDLAESLGLDLPPLSDRDSPALRAAMPDFVAVSNPLDLTAQGLVDPELYYRVLAALFEDERFSAVVVGLIQGDPVTSGIKLPPVLRAMRELNPAKAVICAGLDEGAEMPAHFITELRGCGVPWFPSTERVFRAVTRFCAHALTETASTSLPPVALALPGQEMPAAGNVGDAMPLMHDGQQNDGRVMIPEYRARNLLGQAGIPFGEGHLVTDIGQALASAAQIGYPVVMKAQAARLPHKSDAGGVILNIADAAALQAAWEKLHQDIAAHDPDLRLDGILLERMCAGGLEFIIGARRDSQWGPMLLVGAGGVTAELMKDVCLLDADLPSEAMRAALKRLHAWPLVEGYRGSPPLDVAALIGLIENLGRIMRGTPAIREIDLNPVRVFPVGQGVMALDALMTVAPC